MQDCQTSRRTIEELAGKKHRQHQSRVRMPRQLSGAPHCIRAVIADMIQHPRIGCLARRHVHRSCLREDRASQAQAVASQTRSSGCRNTNLQRSFDIVLSRASQYC